MSGVELRNPKGRWVVWLVVGLILCFIVGNFMVQLGADPCVDDAGRPCSGAVMWIPLLFFGWFPLGFLIAAWASYRARTTITAEGLVVRTLFGNRTYRWDEIQQVTNFTERWYGNGIRTSTERSIRLQLTGGKLRDLPAPKAGRFLGRREFEEGVNLVWQSWKQHATR
jgi:hypothetical protein